MEDYGDIYIHFVGSFGIGLFNRKSEIDLCLVCSTANVKDLLLNKLKQDVEIVNDVSGARFQLLKLEKNTCKFDLGINSTDSIRSTFLLKTYLNETSGLHELIWLCKRFFQMQSLDERISSYAL